jgi:hypothetical protein
LMSARASKRQRSHRTSSGPVVITDRDVELLTLVGLCRYISTDQAAREFFPSVDRCRRRLRQLYDGDGGYIAVTVASSTKPNLVSLARPGLAEVARRTPSLADRIQLAGTIRLAGVDHHLALVDARLFSVHLGARRGTPMTRWCGAGGHLAGELGLPAYHLEPDGIAEFAVPGGSVFVAIEVDLGTESLDVLRSKFERYQCLAADGPVDALWLVASGGERRQQSISDLAERAGLGDWARVLPHSHVITRPVLELPARAGEQAEGLNTLSRTSKNHDANCGACTPGLTVDRTPDRSPDR